MKTAIWLAVIWYAVGLIGGLLIEGKTLEKKIATHGRLLLGDLLTFFGNGLMYGFGGPVTFFAATKDLIVYRKRGRN